MDIFQKGKESTLQDFDIIAHNCLRHGLNIYKKKHFVVNYKSLPYFFYSINLDLNQSYHYYSVQYNTFLYYILTFFHCSACLRHQEVRFLKLKIGITLRKLLISRKRGGSRVFKLDTFCFFGHFFHRFSSNKINNLTR